MSLETYKKKRNFKDTQEPEGKEKTTAKSKRAGGLKFVVQKHNASRLHYDFRLEMEGVLKSWAVPKGPSLNPADKRLAVMVEDHPLDYAGFEGTIAEGNYGAGTVMVWDEGTYLSPKAKTKKKTEEIMLQELEDGSLHIILEGKKLKGEFTLFRFRKGGEQSWLLVKKDDEFASEKDILKEDRSVKTKRSMKEISKD